MLSRKKVKKGAFAGLALHEDSLRYVELEHSSGGFNARRQEFVPLPSGCVSRESIQQFDTLEKAFNDLRSQIGKFTCPVVLGVPARDVMLRPINYDVPPGTPMEDIEDALALEFENYFPYPRAEAAASFAEVEAPVTAQDGEPHTTVLVATSRLECVNKLLRAAEHADMPLGAVEPMNVAFFRAAVGRQTRNEAYLVVGVESEVTNIILGYRDNAILFRTTLVELRNPASLDSEEALAPIVQDVQNTRTFAGNQYRGLAVQTLILGGNLGHSPKLKALLEAWTTPNVSVADIWSSWQIHSELGGVPGMEAAVGLALRDMI